MAKWDFKIVGASFVKELVPIADDVQPRSQSFMQPSFHLEGGKIVMKESGQYVTAIYFPQIGEIDGVAPTDIEDANAKLLTLVENFNGGGGAPGTTPNLTQVLTQGDISTYTVPIPNNTFVTFDLGRELTENYFTTDDVGTGGVFLDKTIIFPENSTIPFQAGYVEDSVTPTPVTLLPYRFTTDAYVFYQGARVTDITIQPEDVCTLKWDGNNSTDGIQIWFLSIVNRGVKLFTCGITQTGSSAPIISNARGAQGATFTRTRLSAGDYRITASKAIWTGALPCYFSDQSATVYTIVDVGINFIQYWFYYLEDASNLRVISLVSLESSGLLDDVLQYGEQITIKYIN